MSPDIDGFTSVGALSTIAGLAGAVVETVLVIVPLATFVLIVDTGAIEVGLETLLQLPLIHSYQ
jgi:hypothetical protein